MNLKNIAGLLLILLSLTWGCSQNAAEETGVNASEKVIDEAPVQSLEKKEVPATGIEAPAKVDAANAVNGSGAPDAYGRKPGEEHYGHSHAPQATQTNSPQLAPNSTATPPATGPDAYGRNPGDEHYGHSHE